MFGEIRVFTDFGLGDPWFVAKDVCKILAMKPKHATRCLDDDEKSKVHRTDLGLQPGRDVLIINESGLYSLILRSRKPEAKAFKKWGTSEIPPAIHKAEKIKETPKQTLVSSAETTLFRHPQFGQCRVIKKDGEPWFVAKDVAEILGYWRPDQAVKKHCKAVETSPLNSGGQVRHLKIIPERDVYRLVMRSKLPAAEEFEEWVVAEVLPAIRKDGAYVQGEEKVKTGEMSEDELVMKAMEVMRRSAKSAN